jgi:hypothetical protein
MAVQIKIKFSGVANAGVDHSSFDKILKNTISKKRKNGMIIDKRIVQTTNKLKKPGIIFPLLSVSSFLTGKRRV